MKLVRLALALAITLGTFNAAEADLIPPGHKSVKHELVFVDSASLDSHRLVAAPIRGLHGVMEVQAGQRFRFSTKYGTRFYLVPDDLRPLPEFDRELFAQWPSVAPPISETRSASMISPVASALTTLRLADVTSSEPKIELVNHIEFDSSGNPVTWKSSVVRPLVLVPAGVLLLLVAALVVRRTRRGTVQSS